VVVVVVVMADVLMTILQEIYEKQHRSFERGYGRYMPSHILCCSAALNGKKLALPALNQSK